MCYSIKVADATRTVRTRWFEEILEKYFRTVRSTGL